MLYSRAGDYPRGQAILYAESFSAHTQEGACPRCHGLGGNALYVLDEPTTGLHPADVERLMIQLDGLVDAGNTVIVVAHDMRVVAGSDFVDGPRARRRRRGRTGGGVRRTDGSGAVAAGPYRAPSR